MSREWDGKMMAHSEECRILTRLLIDLKKKDLGREHAAITMERLDEASKAVGSIQQCRKQGLYRDPR